MINSDQKIDLVIPIETKVRDLDGRLYLALKTFTNSKIGWRVIIGHYKKQPGLYGKPKPFIYLLTSLEHEYAYYWKLLRNKGRAVLLDEEGGVFSTYNSQFPRDGFENYCVKFLDTVFFWGEREKDNWVKRHMQLRKSSIVVSGNPRFDVCKPKFSS